MLVENIKVAVLLPCRNEEATIGSVVKTFKSYIPEASIYVCDNASTDKTAEVALSSGAELRYEPLVGKGRALRRLFSEVESDVYVIADGDGTYDPKEASILIKKLLEDRLDMVIGMRRPLDDRFGHKLGNKLFNLLYSWLFGSGFTDIFSGYRVLSRRFVKSFPASSTGFEIETEISVHASQLCLPVAEVPITYMKRSVGSESKLRTIPDGWRIFFKMFSLLKENRPMFLFGMIGGFLSLLSLIIGVPVVIDFIQTGLVERLPTAVAASAIALSAVLLIVLGTILESIAKFRIEAKRLTYLNNY